MSWLNFMSYTYNLPIALTRIHFEKCWPIWPLCCVLCPFTVSALRSDVQLKGQRYVTDAFIRILKLNLIAFFRRWHRISRSCAPTWSGDLRTRTARIAWVTAAAAWARPTRAATGDANSTSFCHALATPSDWAISGDSPTCVCEMEEVSSSLFYHDFFPLYFRCHSIQHVS